jgi:phosphatidylserine/phosphatidylglycerophosphate/cardiolipin synthase-like enzyme
VLYFNLNLTSSSLEWFVTGRLYYKSLYFDLIRAKRDIYISDWFLSPEIYLLRNSPWFDQRKAKCNLCHLKENNDIEYYCDDCIQGSQLSSLLARCAASEVRIYILIWNETKIAVDLGSAYASRSLRSLSKNIFVVLHPPEFPVTYSHHQKLVVIDQKIAYIGGLDLCFGRFDDPAHRLADQNFQRLMWPGKDYYNPSVASMEGCDHPFTDLLDRSSTPRMPWHDVQTRVDGMAALDVSRNFIQRWNHHRLNQNLPILHVRWNENNTIAHGTCDVQCVRSLSVWSGGVVKEASLLEAYVLEIRNAEHFIYIEQQFFISSSAGEMVRNPIADELVKKILYAYRWKKTFRVVIVLPYAPEGPIASENVQAIIRFRIL